MKIAGFYFLVTIAFVIFSLLTLYAVGAIEFYYYCSRILEGLTWLAPYVILRRYGVRSWICLLFLMPDLVAWLHLGLSLLGEAVYRNHVPIPSITYSQMWLVFHDLNPVCILLSLIGCFLVKAPGIRNGFRFWGLWGVVCFLLGLFSPISHREIVRGTGLANILFYVPLLFLLYKVWRRPPPDSDLEDEVMAIGGPENPAA
jgi:hypothetical protein